MLNFDVITLFPELFFEFTNTLPLKRAIQKKLVSVKIHNLRDYADDNRKTVDHKPYGGGPGMILMLKPIYKCLSTILNEYDESLDKHLLVMTPKGLVYDQKFAAELSLKPKQITLLCGRYEGMDARVLDFDKVFDKHKLKITPVSIGRYVLAGGEIPALAIMESTTRLIKGAIENEESLAEESYSIESEEINTNLISKDSIADTNKETTNYVEYPQYTRPENFMGLKVPEVLINGNHKEIKKWRTENSKLQ